MTEPPSAAGSPSDERTWPLEPAPSTSPPLRPSDPPRRSVPTDGGAIQRLVPPRPPGAGTSRGSSTPGKQRRARLRLHRIDPWSVFVLSLLVNLFLGVVLVVAAIALYAVLQAAGVPDSVNQLVAEVSRSPGEAAPPALLTAGRVLTTSLVIAVVDVVLLTALATLGAVLYNLCASFSGGIEVTLAEQ